MCSSWQALTAWRCVFILFEKTGLSLSDASRVVSWRLPPFVVLRSPSSSSDHHGGAGGGITLRFITVLVLILAWPAQLAGPLASGSVSWIPSSSYQGPGSVLYLGTPSVSHPWKWYTEYPNVREFMVKRSTGLASLTKITTFGNTSQGLLPLTPARRVSLQLASFPSGTAVKNATVPIFKIESFRWVTDLTTLPRGVAEAIRNRTSGYLTISNNLNSPDSDSPLLQTVIGTSALLKEDVWIPPPKDILPISHTFSGIKYAAILVSRNPNGGKNESYDCRAGPSDFDPLPAEMQLLNLYQWNNHSDCFAVAELQVTAGATQCHHGRLYSSSSGDSTCIVVSSSVLLASNETVSPDPLVSEVFAMMPEVQALSAALSLYEYSSLKGDLETYLRNAMIQAYHGTWSALTEYFADSQFPERRLETEIWTPYALLKAQVSPWRVFLWLGLNMLLVLSGLLLMTIQSACEGKTVNDPVVAAIMLDSSEVIRADDTGLCNATDVGQGHGNAKVRLRIKVSGSGSSTGSDLGEGEEYFHPRLVLQDTDLL